MIDKERPFFSFKFSQNKMPVIFLHLPYDNKIVRQKFELFNKKWLPINSEIFYDISTTNSRINDTLDVFFTCEKALEIFNKHIDKETTIFNPETKYILYIKKNNKISGCAYKLEGFREPEKLGCFYDLESKNELDKYLTPLFL